MTKRRWEFQVDDGRHVVELDHGYFLGGRRLEVDGATIIQRGRPFSDHSGDYTFRVGQHDAVLRITTNGFTYSYDVLVDGQSVAGSQGSRPPRPFGGPRPMVILGVIFTGLSIVLLGFIGPLVLAEYRLLTEGAETDATVVGTSQGSGRYGPIFYLEYEFHVGERGATFRGKDDVSERTYLRASPGDRYRVTYVPSDPTINRFAGRDEIVSAVVVGGFLVLTLGVGLLSIIRGQRRLQIERDLAMIGVPLDAVVVKAKEHRVRTYGRVVSLEYTYRDDQGLVHTGRTRSLFPAEAERHPVGSTIRVLYDPRSPRHSVWIEETEGP